MVDEKDYDTYDTYSDWHVFKGKIDDYSQVKIEELKLKMHVEAKKTLEKHGINIDEQHIEWTVQQHNLDGPIFISDPKNGIDGPYITIGWKVLVKDNG